MRIRFDSLCLACVTHTLRDWRGAKVQKVLALAGDAVALELFHRGPAWLVLSWNPERAYVALLRRRPPSLEATPFVTALRRGLDPSRLIRLEQVGQDRILALDFENEEGPMTLIAELMGKHSNVILVDGAGIVRAAAKAVGPSKSKRPILVGRLYTAPPLVRRPSILEAAEGDDLREFEGASPFLIQWIAAGGSLAAAQQAFENGLFAPSQIEGGPCYPLDLAPLDLTARPIPDFADSVGIWLSREAITTAREERERHLARQIERLAQSRRQTLQELAKAADGDARAAEWQQDGQLILANLGSIQAGTENWETFDFAGEPRTIRLDPKATDRENADAMFRRAKKAKSGAVIAKDQLLRVQSELDELEYALERLAEAENLDEFEAEFQRRGWMRREAAVRTDAKAAGPTHKIRELTGPKGYRILIGENSEANDHLTGRLGKPDDLWLHVRGGPSAHGLILTNRQPDRVPPEVLRYAAWAVARHSPSKHAKVVAVDYTLKKFVRRPKGAKAGMAVYTHEKTLHIDPTIDP